MTTNDRPNKPSLVRWSKYLRRDRSNYARRDIAGQRNKTRGDQSLDGAVLKFIRERKELSLEIASKKVGISKSYLTNLENGHKPLNSDLRNRIMIAYGYAPSSFRNLSADEKRSKAVPARYKINILLNQLGEAELCSVLEFLLSQKQIQN